MSPQARQSEAGLTLVEVLLALMIAGLLLTGLFMTMGQVVRSRSSLANRSTPHTVGPAILDAMTRDLSNVYFYDFADNDCFRGTDVTLNGKEADSLSFLSCSKTYAPEEYTGRDDLRHSFVNEVGYRLKRGPSGSPFLELWRREDFHVDAEPHAGGDNVLVYDKVASLKLTYVSRNPSNEEGVAGGQQKTAEEMLQEGWNSVQEQDVPRAILIELTIYAQDSLESIADQIANKTARTYSFKRFITLPQVHMTPTTTAAIAGWDGRLSEPTGPAGPGPGRPGAGPGPGAGGGGRPQARGGAGGGRGQGRGARGQGGGRRGGGSVRNGGGAQSFLQALQGRGGARPSGGGSNPFSALLGGR